MSTGRQRLSGRDYKHAGKSRPLFDFKQYRQFGAGLAVGLVFALFVWIHDQRAGQPSEEELAVEAGPEAVADVPVPASAAEEDEEVATEHIFFEMLPNFEVAVPNRSTIKRSNEPAAPVVTPGAYVLQVGAYRNTSGAELQRDKLARLDIEASILHVSDETVEWHVVRIGPIRDLDRVNAIQKTLQAAGIDVFVQRAGD